MRINSSSPSNQPACKHRLRHLLQTILSLYVQNTTLTSFSFFWVTTILTSHGQRYHCGVGGSGRQPFICFEREERFNEYKSIILKGMAWGLNPLKLKTVFSHALSLSFDVPLSLQFLFSCGEAWGTCFYMFLAIAICPPVQQFLHLPDAGWCWLGFSRCIQGKALGERNHVGKAALTPCQFFLKCWSAATLPQCAETIFE